MGLAARIHRRTCSAALKKDPTRYLRTAVRKSCNSLFILEHQWSCPMVVVLRKSIALNED